jgi:hypothetical protein
MKVSIKHKDPQTRYQEIPDITEPPSKSTISIQISTNKLKKSLNFYHFRHKKFVEKY